MYCLRIRAVEPWALNCAPLSNVTLKSIHLPFVLTTIVNMWIHFQTCTFNFSFCRESSDFAVACPTKLPPEHALTLESPLEDIIKAMQNTE